MLGKLLKFKKKEQDWDITMTQIDLRPDKELHYKSLLNRLNMEERAMNNPLLKDWMTIRNKIRSVERKLKEIRNDSSR